MQCGDYTRTREIHEAPLCFWNAIFADNLPANIKGVDCPARHGSRLAAMVTWLTKDWDFWELLVPQILRGTSMMLAMAPINNLSLGTLPPAQLKNASGLFNLTRNLGGAVGLALINTVLNNRWDLHFTRLREHVQWASTAAVEQLDNMTRTCASHGLVAETAALKQMAAPLMRRPTGKLGPGGGH